MRLHTGRTCCSVALTYILLKKKYRSQKVGMQIKPICHQSVTFNSIRSLTINQFGGGKSRGADSHAPFPSESPRRRNDCAGGAAQ